MNSISRRALVSLAAAAGSGLLSSGKSVLALQGGEPMQPFNADRIKECQLLYAADLSSRDVGLGAVDFGSVREGSPVPVYECANGGLTFMHNEVPLSSGGHVFASFASDVDGGAQLSLWMGKALEEYVDYHQSSEVALIADAYGMNIYDGSRVVRICERTDEFDSSGYDDIESISESVLSHSVNLSSSFLLGETIDIEQVLLDASLGGSLDPQHNQIYPQPYYMPTDYIYRATNGIDQGSFPICWAATIAYIYNYYRGTTYSAFDVAEDLVGGYNYDMEPDQIATSLRNYGLGNYWHVNSQPTGSTIYSNINSYRLMAGILKTYNSSNVFQDYHTVAIMGASNSTGIIGIHDSNGGDFYFVYPATTGSYTYKYWHHTGAYKAKMVSHIKKYD